MVIEITWADVEVAGNMVGADVALAMFVEQHQAGIDDFGVGAGAGFFTHIALVNRLFIKGKARLYKIWAA